jgi:hypothetical protein
MMTLYDLMKDKQLQSINTMVKKKPVSYNMDFMLLQANKEKAEMTQQIKAH